MSDDATLHAYVDGELTPEDAARVATWLQANPTEAQRVLAWQAQRQQLQALRRDLLDEPLPPRLLQAWDRGAAPAAGGSADAGPAATGAQPPASLRRWAQAANGPWLAVATLLLGLGLGWSLRPWLAPGAADRALAQGRSLPAPAPVPAYVREAAAAHALYVPERRHPVEVGAEQQEHLVQWLGKRLGTPLRVPQLEGLGYRLVGGRLLPGGAANVSGGDTAGAASAPANELTLARAQFMYENAEGERLTLYVAMATAPGAEQREAAPAAFRFTRSGSGATQRHSFYWQDGALRYALTGGSDRDRLAAVAERVYHELSRERSAEPARP